MIAVVLNDVQLGAYEIADKPWLSGVRAKDLKVVSLCSSFGLACIAWGAHVDFELFAGLRDFEDCFLRFPVVERGA